MEKAPKVKNFKFYKLYWQNEERYFRGTVFCCSDGTVLRNKDGEDFSLDYDYKNFTYLKPIKLSLSAQLKFFKSMLKEVKP